MWFYLLFRYDTLSQDSKHAYRVGLASDKMIEKKPIIKILFLKPKEAWFTLSQEKRKEFVDKAMRDVEEVGTRAY
jgi:hypothetical protein